MNVLRPEKKLAVISMLVEGNSVRSVERMTGVHRDTILRLLVRVGHHCDNLMETHLRDVRSRYVQCDEIWTFVGKKQRRLPAPELARGVQYVFVAIDAETKLVPAFVVGKREATTARLFMWTLAQRLDGGPIQITTDSYNAYQGAIGFAFKGEVAYATETKDYVTEDSGRGRYAPPRVLRVSKRDVFGAPDPEFVSTAYIERQNWTMRTSMRRMTRLSNGFSRKLDNLKAAVSLHFACYNFVRVHRSLRMTPAMAAGISTRPWGLEEFVA